MVDEITSVKKQIRVLNKRIDAIVRTNRELLMIGEFRRYHANCKKISNIAVDIYHLGVKSKRLEMEKVV